jgi:hypothetical protein
MRQSIPFLLKKENSTMLLSSSSQKTLTSEKPFWPFVTNRGLSTLENPRYKTNKLIFMLWKGIAPFVRVRKEGQQFSL